MRSTSCRAALPVLLAAALAACGARSGDATPRLESVDPPRAHASRSTEIVIHGGNFYVAATQRVGGGASVDARFRSWVDDVELEGVRWVDAGTLVGRIPAGLAAGSHPLRVASPAGAEARLDGAVEIFAGTGAQLSAVAAPSAESVLVGDALQVVVTVTNTGDEAADLVPTMDVEGGVGFDLLAEPDEVRLEAGATTQLAWTWRAAAAGVATFHAKIVGMDARTGAAIAASADAVSTATAPPPAEPTTPTTPTTPPEPPPPTTPPPALTAIAVAADDVRLGETLSVTLRVTNASDAAVRVTPSVTVGGSATLTRLSAPEAATVAARATQAFTWRYSPKTVGLATFSLLAAADGGLQATARATTQVEPPETAGSSD